MSGDYYALEERKFVERVKGIEPSYEAWEAAVLPLNYTRVRHLLASEDLYAKAAELYEVSPSLRLRMTRLRTTDMLKPGEHMALCGCNCTRLVLTAQRRHFSDFFGECRQGQSLCQKTVHGLRYLPPKGDEMAYAVEAVRWRADGKIAAVRWHSFFYDTGLRRGRSDIASIEAVIAAAERGHAIHVCYDSVPGSLLVVLDAPDGQKTIGDNPADDPNQTLRRLPIF